MKISDISQLFRRYRHLISVQNTGLLVALVIAAGWMWGAITTLQRNYQYQRQVDDNALKIELAKLQNQNYSYQQAYYRSSEYLELSARSELGKAQPGEHLVLLPDSEAIKDTASTRTTSLQSPQTQSNLSRWFDFFFGVR